MTGQRTEQPTPRRLREARRRGEVARSADLSASGALAGGLAGLCVFGPGMVRALARALSAALASAADVSPDPSQCASAAIRLVLGLSLPIAGCALAGGVAAAAVQTGAGFFPDVLRPRLERLDPLRGLRRLVSPVQLCRAGLALLKAGVLVTVLALWWRDSARTLATAPRASSAAGAVASFGAVAPLAIRLAAALAVIGVVDLALERRRVRRALMMTRDEVRRELREDEGDAERRADRRRVHRALVEAGPVAAATVVVVNPTRVAVALRHDRAAAGAPRVVAKGTGIAAGRIRSAARRAGVPIVRDVALARALHRLGDVGDEIPEELYDAAAALLAHLYATEKP
jgi:flagellar biosynthesis protein FlhB